MKWLNYSVLLVLFIAAILYITLAACQTTPQPAPEPVPVDKCPAAEYLGSFLTQQVSVALGCKNAAAVKKDMVASIYRTGMCKEYQQSTAIYELICGKLGDLVRGTAVSALPKDWNCNGGIPAQAAYDYIAKTCIHKLTKGAN